MPLPRLHQAPGVHGSLALRQLARARAYSTRNEVDVLFIGSGPAGYVGAIKAAQLGLKTACVEKRDTLGGTCLNVGCIPSKALLNSSHMFQQAKHGFAGHGIDVTGVALNLPQMLGQKEKAVRALTGGIEMLFKKNKVTALRGEARITGPHEVVVKTAAGGSETWHAKNIVIATGSASLELPGIKVDEKTIVSSTGALSLERVPRRLTVIGGGIIGLELGSVWSRLGSEVTVVEYMDAIGGGMDGGTAAALHKILQKQGLKFRLGTKVGSASKRADGSYTLEMQAAKGGAKETLEADVILVCVGRRPCTDGLGLKEAGVKTDAKGRVVTDSKYTTSVPSIRAIGDVVVGPMLAHKGEDEGIAVAEILASGHGHVNYDVIPSVVYTHPEVAWCGKTEEQLKADGVQYLVGNFPFMANSRARTVNDADGFVKVLVDSKTDRMLGVHIVGPNAGELIGEACLALEYGASSEDVARTCHAHPTLSEALKEACLAAHGLRKAINF